MPATWTQETQLPHHPLVISHPMPDAQSVALGIFVDVGSRDESPEQAGIAHALEHMLFKGTRHLDVHALSETLDQLGGHTNAFTSRERTCFHTQVLHEDAAQALDILMDMVLEPALPEDEWKREREVIFSEMGMVEDNPDEWFYDRHIQAVYAGQQVGKPTLGTRDVLSHLSSQDLRHYLEHNYRPPRLLIAASGNIQHDDVLAAVQQRTWKPSQSSTQRKPPILQVGKHFFERDMEQVQVVASLPCISAASDERPLAWLANQMLGGGMSSMLFREIRERRGLAYSVSSHLSPLSDAGLWSVSCDTHPTMVAACIELLQENMQQFATHIDAPLLARAQRQMEVQFRMGMDSIEGNMMYLANRLDEPNLLSQQQWIEAVKAVKLDEIQAWSQHYLDADAVWSVAGNDAALSSAQNVL
ncbi:MAG: pitrilysin family protein [Mariprofundaceae bacterium]|nr:pitrilysin family protein [Mariprofundaceae bacterium]